MTTFDAPTSGERLNKYLALHLGISRREADNLIEAGKVTVNDQAVPLGARVLEGDSVKVRGKAVAPTAHKQYLAFHKPAGYVSSRKGQGDTPTLYALLPKELHALKPVGRLDKDSSGLILLTNDGDFAYRMTHPKFYKVKIYEVQLDRDLAPLHQQMISDYGIQIEDGVSKFMIEKLDGPLATYRIIMSEGRNRQIRRTFRALGYTVTYLHRTQFGNFSLDGLKSGEYKDISAEGA